MMQYNAETAANLPDTPKSARKEPTANLAETPKIPPFEKPPVAKKHETTIHKFCIKLMKMYTRERTMGSQGTQKGDHHQGGLTIQKRPTEHSLGMIGQFQQSHPEFTSKDDTVTKLSQ
eukprot:13473282-Ditylum_brightwellii.AAC.1